MQRDTKSHYCPNSSNRLKYIFYKTLKWPLFVNLRPCHFVTCFCRQTSFTVRNFLKRSEIFWSDIYGVNSLASDSRPTRKTDTVVQDGHVCLLRFGCNAVCETLLYQFTSSTFGVWITFFFPLLPPPAYFHFPWQSRLVCVQYVSKSLSVPLAECRPPAHTQRETDAFLYSQVL